MKIHTNFIGGNSIVKNQTAQAVVLENELRDTTKDWFYWAFCVEGAQGKTITFHLQNSRLGYFGPAVSYDLETWHWLGSLDSPSSFTYTFGETESTVYFAHFALRKLKTQSGKISLSEDVSFEYCLGILSGEGQRIIQRERTGCG